MRDSLPAPPPLLPSVLSGLDQLPAYVRSQLRLCTTPTLSSCNIFHLTHQKSALLLFGKLSFPHPPHPPPQSAYCIHPDRRDAEEGGPQELIVVTIIVAADGRFKLPKITSRGELRTALQRLGAVTADDILAVEVRLGGSAHACGLSIICSTCLR